MDNKQIASIFYETADLLEIAGEDSFRIRSYRRAAEAVEAWHQPLGSLRHDEKAILAIPGIGKGMLANLRDIFNRGEMSLHRELLKRFQPSMLELLKIPGLGPKTIALIWDAFQVGDLAGVEQLARAGKLQALPRLSAKSEQKILKGIADYHQISGRFLLDTAERLAEQLISRLAALPGVAKTTPAGSLRRGRETVGDLDLLVTGACCTDNDSAQLSAVIESVVTFPGITEVLAKGENKVSLKLRGGMQVDVRLLPPESYGAAMQYFTGSKMHNVSLRQRALKLGYTLNEYGLARVDDATVIASATEEEIYRALGLDWIPPELRENCGEIEAAAKHQLPVLVTEDDLRGDVHAHTTETDGRNSILEMAEAARAKRYEYCAITDHSKNLAMTNGMDDQRALAHIKRIREVDREIDGIRILAGIECDILADGSLDLSDGVLDEMDIVVGSVHSYFNQPPEQMSERMLRAIESGKLHVLGHPFGRMLLRRDGYSFNLHAICEAARKHNVALEHNANPHRLDLSDVNLRIAKSLGVKIVINTDAHSTSDYDKMKYGILQLRRAWLTKGDVLNTLPLDDFLQAIKKPKGHSGPRQ
ncbi:MAG: DNA polymerase/3'-5' exonuclease PolX [Acidobacteriaceae bacterium]